MSGTIYHICSVCGSEMYPKSGAKSNGDTITEFVIEPCKACAAKASGAGEHISQQAKECHTAGQGE